MAIMPRQGWCVRKEGKLNNWVMEVIVHEICSQLCWVIVQQVQYSYIVAINLLIILVYTIPDSKFRVAHMGPTWVLSAPGGPHVGPMNLAIRDTSMSGHWQWALTRFILYKDKFIIAHASIKNTIHIPELPSLGNYYIGWLNPINYLSKHFILRQKYPNTFLHVLCIWLWSGDIFESYLKQGLTTCL